MPHGSVRNASRRPAHYGEMVVPIPPSITQPTTATSWHRALLDKEEVLRQAAAAADERGFPDDIGLADYLLAFYRHTAGEDVLAMDPVDLVGLALSQRGAAQHRRPGMTIVRTRTPTLEADGWSTGHSCVEVVTDDMPFLVDSITAELGRTGRAIHLVVHPQMLVRRDEGGTLLDARAAPTSHDEEPGWIREAWIHVDMDRDSGTASLMELQGTLEDVLADVRAAVEDWPMMREAAHDAAQRLASTPIHGFDPERKSEAAEFLLWLADNHFTFLGYREYRLAGSPGHERLELVRGTGLGILREDVSSKEARGPLPAVAAARAHDRSPLVLTKANSRSTVHRSVYLDYVGVKVFDQRGEVVGERRFLGLFSATAYAQSVGHVPLLRYTARRVLQMSGFAADSHGGKDLLQFIETYPRDELFQVGDEELLDVAMSVLHLLERRRTKVFVRRDPYERFASCLVYLPRDRYTTSVRLRMQKILMDAFHGESVDYTARVTESVLARLHVVVRVERGGTLGTPDLAQLQEALARAARSWDDDFQQALLEQVGEERAGHLSAEFAGAFPESYKEAFPARTGVVDVVRLAELAPDSMALNLYQPYGTDGPSRRLKVYRNGAPLALSEVQPVVERMGVRAIDERPFPIAAGRTAGAGGGSSLFVYDFGLELQGEPVGQSDLKERFEEALLAAWQGDAETDRFGSLILSAGLTWRQVSLMRAISRYLRQTGLPFSQPYVASVLDTNAGITRKLVHLFAARFDPARGVDGRDAARTAGVDQIAADIEEQLNDVMSLDQDRILRAVLGVIRACVRTNYYRPTADGAPRTTLAFKLLPALVPGLPKPLPHFEIWVYSPRVEGVHLRFGRVARGGLRWSDRPEDFRTEILGLVKAQAVKNAVIVPVGAKGGFFAKRLPDPARDRAAWQAEGRGAYSDFIAALLDVTDNLVDDAVVPPPAVVRHDDDDPYLVVAADKGTATFSDLANEVSARYGFWLGDAFASGGSAGYDHKSMGITARGAWESVKTHFREMGIDTQSEPFTVVGIGDMSGDVFGNGMLLSPHIRLVAAFDHRDILIDPAPDAAATFAQRRRLFEMPRSSWADFDRAVLSPGGGVFPRSAKAVPISPQMRQLLDLADDVQTLTPAALIRAILRAPVDLLWNGGIGTYVKASAETNADVGDRANDAIRIDATELRCRVVGEGGNLGFTQLGRVEAARRGVRLNTDAIDNSAGVDTSDHEVNIKILLDKVVAAGDLTAKQRNALLAGMTDEVAQLVLRDNYDQNVALANARYGAGRMLAVHARQLKEFERRGALDRALEFLPVEADLTARAAAGLGLTSPELSVLLAYSKMTLTQDLGSSALPDDPYFAAVLSDYFPRALVDRFGDRLGSHPLRRDIVITCLVNDLVNRGGSTFAYRVAEDLAATPVDVVRGYAFTRDVFDLNPLWRRIAALDNELPTSVQAQLYLEVRRLLDRGSRWLVQTKGVGLDLRREVAQYAPVVRDLGDELAGLLRGEEADRLARLTAGFTDQGVPHDLAVDVAAGLYQFTLLDVTNVAHRTGFAPREVAAVYYETSARFGIDDLLTRISELPRSGRWLSLSRQAVRSDVYAALASLTGHILRDTRTEVDAPQRLAQWEADNRAEVDRVRTVLAEINALDEADLASVSVATRALRTLITQSQAG